MNVAVLVEVRARPSGRRAVGGSEDLIGRSPWLQNFVMASPPVVVGEAVAAGACRSPDAMQSAVDPAELASPDRRSRVEVRQGLGQGREGGGGLSPVVQRPKWHQPQQYPAWRSAAWKRKWAVGCAQAWATAGHMADLLHVSSPQRTRRREPQSPQHPAAQSSIAAAAVPQEPPLTAPLSEPMAPTVPHLSPGVSPSAVKVEAAMPGCGPPPVVSAPLPLVSSSKGGLDAHDLPAVDAQALTRSNCSPSAPLNGGDPLCAHCCLDAAFCLL